MGITWVHSSTGLKLPIREIAAALAVINETRPDGRRVIVVVDGVHGFGVEDENVADMGVDFFVAGTYKWMFGPCGHRHHLGKSRKLARAQVGLPGVFDGNVHGMGE